MDAIDRIIQESGFDKTIPTVVVGACGFTGTQVVAQLRRDTFRNIIEIDPRHAQVECRSKEALLRLKPAPVILVNIARDGTIEEYAPLLWPGTVVLNEVYPEAGARTLNLLRTNKVRYLHIKGVEGVSLPKMPGAYAGAIPCCAASAAEYEETEKLPDHHKWSDSTIALVEM